MTEPSYSGWVKEKLLAWAVGAEPISTPPMPIQARVDAGYLLRRVQRAERLGPPMSEPRSDVGANCHELRLTAEKMEWRVFYHVGVDVVVVLGVFHKKSQKTPKRWVDLCRKRLLLFESA
jgi:phage-related protein